MILTEKSVLKFFTALLLIFCLFTLAQAYYSAYAHMALLILCFLLCRKEQHVILGFFAKGAMICLLFVAMAFFKNDGAVMEHIGFYLHYITWPLLFVCVTSRYNVKEIKHLLLFIIVICIIGDILSLIQLNINPDISRLLSGGQLRDEKIQYYKLGVGGYGYVFAMSFIMYGVIRWLKNSKSRIEKIYLTIFVIVNLLFIIYASYTTAIVISIVLIAMASASNIQKGYKTAIIIITILAFVAFINPMLELCYDIANELELEWVARRFEQILSVQDTGDMSVLKRYALYIISWNTFLQNPILGGTDYGAHSQILDTLARYGMLGMFLPIFLGYCKSFCSKVLGKSDLNIVFIAFMIFSCIDTCSVMQIPVVVFFVTPLMLYVEQKEAAV